VATAWFELKKDSVTPAYAEDIWRSLTLHVFPSMKSTPLSEVSAPMVIKLLRPIEAKGSLETIKRVRQRLTVGRVYLSHFSIVKRVDFATPKILEACCAGQHFKKIVMSVHRAGGEKQKFLEIVFEEVIISGIHSGNIFDAAASSFPEEVVWFDYAKVNMIYSQQSRTTGIITGQISAGWDQTRNNTYA
jgi:type VI secretion system secreted protein Hcp